MSLIPAFEIGVWNAWIFTLYLPLHPLVMMLIDKAVGTRDMSKKMENYAHNKVDKITFIFANFILFFGLFVYSIFLPLKLGTAWVYIGLTLCLLGVIVWTIAIVNAVKVPLGNPFSKGLYRYSRHPMTLSSFFIYIGAGIASASWVFLLLSIVLIVLTLVLTRVEERHCLEKYGDSYREYMTKTPRWMGIPKP